MNTIQEMKDFLLAVDPGKAIFKVSQDYNSVVLNIEPWAAKELLPLTAVTCVDYFLINTLNRSFNKETRKMEINLDNFLPRLYDFIVNTTIEMAEETSPVNQPKRTNAYKDIVLVAKTNSREEAFINDMLPIINYYYKAKADSKNEMDMVVHKNNIQALFNVLRKKHGTKKTM